MHLKGVIQAKPSNRHGRIRVSHEKEACKYVKPSYIDDEAKLDDKTKLDNKTKLDSKAKLDDKDTLDKKSSEDGDKTDGEESGQLTPPPKSVSNDNEIGAIFILI